MRLIKLLEKPICFYSTILSHTQLFCGLKKKLIKRHFCLPDITLLYIQLLYRVRKVDSKAYL